MLRRLLFFNRDGKARAMQSRRWPDWSSFAISRIARADIWCWTASKAGIVSLSGNRVRMLVGDIWWQTMIG
jgi:hypothetical protein